MKITNILKSTLVCFLFTALISCNNLNSELNDVAQSPTIPSTNGKTLLKIYAEETSNGRTIIPSSDASILSNFVIRGKNINSAEPEQELATAANLTELNAVIIEFDGTSLGNWTLTLTGSCSVGGEILTFTDTQTVTIKANSLNTANFKLKTTDITSGGLNIKVTFTGNVDTVIAKLQNADKTTDIATKTFNGTDFTTISETVKSFTFTRDIADSTEQLTSGTYYLLFSFYNSSVSTETPLNTLPNFVRIVNGLTTSAELTINLNEVYTITYNNNGGTLADGQVRTEKYSRKNAVTLPNMERGEFIFGGWYETSDFSGNAVTEIPKGSKGDKTLYAKFISNTLYVNGTSGSETNDGLTSEAPLATLSSALGRIISFGDRAADYTIKVSGTLTGAQTIPSTLTTEMASSLTLEGVTGQSGEVWVDVLNGGFTESSKGTTLTLNSSVPVTIKNLKITGGYVSGSGGGGIKVSAGSSLTMESGEISGNTGKDGGAAAAGGVYLSHGTDNFGTVIVPGAVFTMNGGTICNNTGNGVTLYDGAAPGTFNMNGGTISGNSGYGLDMVYSTGPFGTFTMNNDAIITSDNKVFLGFPGSTKITIAGELTRTAPVATIKLNRYTANDQIIALADTNLAEAVTKFVVEPQTSGSVTTYWTIDESGKLQEAAPNITPSMIVQNAADIKFTFTADESTITKGTPTTVAITPNVTFKDGDTTRHLYYIDGLVYKGKSPMPQDLITDELVAWDITLWNEDEQIINPDENTHYVLTNDNTITLNIPLPDTFVIKVRATYLGYTHDAEFPITCE